MLNEHLRRHSRIAEVRSKMRKGMHALSKVHSTFPAKVLLDIYYVFVHSHLSHALEVHGLTCNMIPRLVYLL